MWDSRTLLADLPCHTPHPAATPAHPPPPASTAPHYRRARLPTFTFALPARLPVYTCRRTYACPARTYASAARTRYPRHRTCLRPTPVTLPALC